MPESLCQKVDGRHSVNYRKLRARYNACLSSISDPSPTRLSLHPLTPHTLPPACSLSHYLSLLPLLSLSVSIYRSLTPQTNLPIATQRAVAGKCASAPGPCSCCNWQHNPLDFFHITLDQRTRFISV